MRSHGSLKPQDNRLSWAVRERGLADRRQQPRPPSPSCKIDKAHRGPNGFPHMKTLKRHLAALLARSESEGRSPCTIRMLSHCVGHTLQWLKATKHVTNPAQLRGRHIDSWAQVIRNHRTAKGMPLKQNSVIKQFDSDRVFIKWLEANGALPAGFHKALPRMKRDRLLPTSVLKHEQMVNLLDRTDITTSDGFQLRTMEELLYTSGMRVGELLSLNLDSVDLTTRTARVFGKGRKERIVPIGQTANTFLVAYLDSIRPNRTKTLNQPAFWLDRRGNRMSYQNFRRRLIAVVNKAGIAEIVRPHTFRRSCATALIRNGANIWHVKELLGHERLDTLAPYIRLEISDLRKTHFAFHPRDRRAKSARPIDVFRYPELPSLRHPN